VFTGQTHQDFPAALEEISLDRENTALVITGTGDSFIDQIDGPRLGEIFKPAARRSRQRRPRPPRPGSLTNSVRQAASAAHVGAYIGIAP
jgi:hypothetical protein